MAHQTLKSAYERLSDRLNRFPQGAPSTDLLFAILKMLFSEREAGLVSQLPIKPFTAAKASRIWKMDEAEAERVLDELASRAALLDMEDDRNGRTYVLPPPMAGFFEFSLMRVRGDIDQKALSELFYQYLNVEEEFIRQLFTDGETQLGRVFVNEEALPEDNALHVLDYERASRVIQSATHIGIGMCYCRHKMQHMDRACDAPMDICMTFNTVAASLTRHGAARPVSATECMGLLDQAYAHNLVQFGENVREGVSFICNCCKCCCEAMIAAQRFGTLNPVHTTNYLPAVNAETCTGCGRCTVVCPVDAVKLRAETAGNDAPVRKAVIDEASCLGCGVCARACGQNALRMQARPERVITPVDGVHRAVVMAIERGKLQNLIFDNQALASHRAMAAILGAILRLPLVKRAMASKQMKSRYLEALFTRVKA